MAGTRTMGTKLTLKKAGDELDDTTISSLTSIGAITGEAEEIDVTTLDSPNGAKEYIKGATDWGSQDIEANLVDGNLVTKLESLFVSGDLRSWEIETPAGSKIAYNAFIKTFEHGEKTVDGLDTYKLTLRLSGKPVFTPAS